MRAIVAVNNLGFIGVDDKLLWHNKEDLRHFKNMTYGSRLLVGYRTAMSLPSLSNRELIVVDRDIKLTSHYYDVEWCIGGKKTYEQFCDVFTELHISHIDNNYVGNVTFPDFSNLNPKCEIFNYKF
jgi:dihydrofolate reductase|tara:strand:+ start:833 stop:1210 length:378 start_codon:yes stop_codon:yes gene_type:complete